MTSQESVENVITFPEDPPKALEAIVKMLYGMPLAEAMLDAPPGLANEIAPIQELYKLAQKYQLPSVAAHLLACLEFALEGSDADLVLGSIWSLGRQLYDTDDDLPEMRAVVLAALQKKARRISLQGRRDVVEMELSKCPRFALDLALSGGLDGKGLRLKKTGEKRKALD